MRYESSCHINCENKKLKDVREQFKKINLEKGECKTADSTSKYYRRVD